jgi:hypothetical protein
MFWKSKERDQLKASKPRDSTSVVDIQKAKNNSTILDSHKPKDLAKWTVTSHNARCC